MSEIAEGITSQRGVERVIELERADAAKAAIADAIKALQEHKIKAEPYRKAFKAAIKLLMNLQNR